jgi:hypothetical protein
MLIIKSSKKLIYKGSSFCNQGEDEGGEHIYLFAEEGEDCNCVSLASNKAVDYIKIEKR